MPEMFFSNPPATVSDVTQAAIANATGDLVTATYVLVAAGVLVGLLQVGVVWRGINQMSQATRTRAAEQDQRHKEAMTALHALIRHHRPTRRAAIRPSP